MKNRIEIPPTWCQQSRTLSLAAKGAWLEIQLQLLHSKTPGFVWHSDDVWARVMGTSVENAAAVFCELYSSQLAIAYDGEDLRLMTAPFLIITNIKIGDIHGRAVASPEMIREWIRGAGSDQHLIENIYWAEIESVTRHTPLALTDRLQWLLEV